MSPRVLDSLTNFIKFPPHLISIFPLQKNNYNILSPKPVGDSCTVQRRMVGFKTLAGVDTELSPVLGI
jgi:hypothetical protein